MGLKDAAKALVAEAHVPVVPGYHGSRQEPDFLRQKADEIGYPVLIKAVAGGGGKGMRRVDQAPEFEAALESAQREAAGAFGDPRVLVEKYVLSPRHIEIQVFADRHGNVVHLFERDCSLQRRHQKVIEEAPAPGMTQEMRAAMGRAAVEAARAVGYVGAGTIEFIADGREGLRPDRFWFMEMNTRLQVEHPVTEAITGLDLVELQFRVAAGETLPFSQDELRVEGHAVEARLYAEDPEKGFLPSTGVLWAFDAPAEEDGIRIDTGVRQYDEITPYYDPMIAKVIAHAPTRDAALDRLDLALERTVIAGPKTNLRFLRALCADAEFREGRFDTGLIDRKLESLGAVPQSLDARAVRLGVAELARDEMQRIEASAAMRSDESFSPWALPDAFQLSGRRRSLFPAVVEGARIDAALVWRGDGAAGSSFEVELPGAEGQATTGPAVVVRPGRRGEGEAPDYELAVALGFANTREGRRLSAARESTLAARPDAGHVLVVVDGRQTDVRIYDPFAVDLEHIEEGGAVKAPMHGKLVAIFVNPGDMVVKGQRLAVVEAMKMEHALVAPLAGKVVEVAVEPGAQVAEGARLIVVAPAGGS